MIMKMTTYWLETTAPFDSPMPGMVDVTSNQLSRTGEGERDGLFQAAGPALRGCRIPIQGLDR